MVRMGRQHVRGQDPVHATAKDESSFNVEIMPGAAGRHRRDAGERPPDLSWSRRRASHSPRPGSETTSAISATQAGLPKRCTSHGLRKAAATYLAEHGATDHQLMAWFGWTSISQAQVYTQGGKP